MQQNTMCMFGSCCEGLRAAIEDVPESFFRVEESIGVFFLAVGYAQTENGPAFFDQAVLFCPFCGAALQTRDEIAAKAG